MNQCTYSFTGVVLVSNVSLNYDGYNDIKNERRIDLY